MSYVTDIFVYGLDIEKPIKKINSWISQEGYNGVLELLNVNLADGRRPFGMEVYAAAINYFGVDDFIQYLHNLEFGMFDGQAVVLLTTETNQTIVFRPNVK